MKKRELCLIFLSSIDSNLQFTMEVDGNGLYFLDLKLTLKENKSQATVYNLQFIVYSLQRLIFASWFLSPSILGIQKKLL